MDENTLKAIRQICDTIENCVDYSKTTKIRMTFFICLFSTMCAMLIAACAVERNNTRCDKCEQPKEIVNEKKVDGAFYKSSRPCIKLV